MEKRLYIKVLSELAACGINYKFDLFEVFDKSLVKPASPEDVAIQSRVFYINDFLKEIKNDGFIDYKEAIPPEPINNTISWGQPFEVIAWIKPKGYEYYTTLTGISDTKVLSRWALGVSVFSMLISLGLSLYLSISPAAVKYSTKSIDSLQRLNTHLRGQIHKDSANKHRTILKPVLRVEKDK